MNSELEVTTDRSETSVAVDACPVCGAAGMSRFFDMPQVPVNSIALWPTREAALACPSGCTELAFCADCGAIANLAFDSELLTYDSSYDNSLHFSKIFQKYAEETAHSLVEKYSLRGKDIIDVGCGKAEFLALLCQLGNNRGVGFDPTFIAGRADTAAGQGITIVKDLYSDRYTEVAADAVICRHVLEHIPDPRTFLRNIRAAIAHRTNTMVFFELPNALDSFRNRAIWDIIYEHCFYYTPGALARLFASCGFDVLAVRSAFQDQYLCLEARPASGGAGRIPLEVEEVDSVERDIAAFAGQYHSFIAEWRTALSGFARASKRVALWGAGAKGAIFLNTFRELPGLEYIVDVNVHKHGRYVPGSGQRVVSPEFLVEYRPDVLLVMNGNYLEEIQRQVSNLGLATKIMVV